MVRETERSAILRDQIPGERSPTNILATQRGVQLRGLVVTSDRALMRAFQRELRRCADCSVSIEIRRTLQEAEPVSRESYDWVAIDLDGAMAPSEGVRLARRGWPGARVAVLSYWWSERDAIAREVADVIIHKPLRSPEVLALWQSIRPQRGQDVRAALAR